MKNNITSGIVSALASVFRFKLTEERISTLRKIHGSDSAFLDLAHKFAGATNYRSQNKYAAQIRAYVPGDLAAKWTERDARKAAPVLVINERVKVHYKPLSRRQPFNTFRVVVQS